MKNQKAVFSQNAAMKLTTPSRQFFKPALATTLAIGSWRLVLLLATAVSLIGYPKPASAATVNVSVGVCHPPCGYYPWMFSPSSVTIHSGDQVKWTWASSGHSTTSGRPGMPNGIWNSGVLSQGATFTHTFNSVGTFPYYCKLHGDYFPPPYNEVGQVIVTSATPTPTLPPVIDFNSDGHPDYVLQNPSTHQTAIWYLNNNVYVGSAYGPTLTGGWSLRGGADFNRDSHPDYALFNSVTEQTGLWYLSGPTFIGSAYGPTLPNGWELVATTDFNGDNKPDYVLYDSGTDQTAIWYLNNNVYVGGGYGPTLPVNWSLVGVADFDGEGHQDYVLFNSSNHQTAIWYLSGRTFLGGAYGPTIPSGWALVATADFNSDGHPDYLLYNRASRQTAIWYLNNNVYVSGVYGPTLPVGWSLVGP